MIGFYTNDEYKCRHWYYRQQDLTSRISILEDAGQLCCLRSFSARLLCKSLSVKSNTELLRVEELPSILRHSIRYLPIFVMLKLF